MDTTTSPPHSVPYLVSPTTRIAYRLIPYDHYSYYSSLNRVSLFSSEQPKNELPANDFFRSALSARGELTSGASVAFTEWLP